MGLLPVNKHLQPNVAASWSFRHVTVQKPDSANFSEDVAFQKNTMLAKNLVCCFFNCKIVTGHEIIDFLKK